MVTALTARRPPFAFATIAVAFALVVSACTSGTATPSVAPTATTAPPTAATPAPSTGAACPAVDAASFVTPGELSVSVSTTAPPLDFLDASGKSVGMYIDLVNLWAKDLGIPKVNFVQGPFQAMLPGLTAGKWDMGGAGVSQTAERKASTDYTLTTPYLANGVTLIVKKDSGINSWNGMAGKTLGGAAGEAELMEAEAHLKELGVTVKESLGFPGGLEARQALLNGQVDAVAGDSAELLYYINSAPEAATLALVPGDPISIVPSGTVLRNQNTALIAAINCEIKKQLADGTMAALAKQWFGSSQSVDNLLKLGGS